MASKYSETGVGGLTAAGDNTRFRQPGTGPTGGGADGTATSTVDGQGNVDSDIDRLADRLFGREGKPGVKFKKNLR